MVHVDWRCVVAAVVLPGFACGSWSLHGGPGSLDGVPEQLHYRSLGDGLAVGAWDQWHADGQVISVPGTIAVDSQGGESWHDVGREPSGVELSGRGTSVPLRHRPRWCHSFGRAR